MAVLNVIHLWKGVQVSLSVVSCPHPGGQVEHKDDDNKILQVAHCMESDLSPCATHLKNIFFSACVQAMSNSRRVWQQVQWLRHAILVTVLCASFLVPDKKLKHAPAYCRASVCSSALEVHDGLVHGMCMNMWCLQSCSASKLSFPSVQLLHAVAERQQHRCCWNLDARPPSRGALVAAEPAPVWQSYW
jgi:hypothetical protein